MQEGLLPNRLLCYTSSQVIWKCCEEVKYERGVTNGVYDLVDLHCKHSEDPSFGSGWLWEMDPFIQFKSFPRYLPSNPEYVLSSDPEVFRLWYELVENCTRRKFRRIGDRLVAISGLAKMFGNAIRCWEYAAGLWKPDLIRGLLWHAKDRDSFHGLSLDRMRS